jgi:hypothetical protein
LGLAVARDLRELRAPATAEELAGSPPWGPAGGGFAGSHQASMTHQPLIPLSQPGNDLAVPDVGA